MTSADVEPTRTAYDEVATSYAAMLPDTRYEAAPELAMVQHFVEGLESAAVDGARRRLRHRAHDHRTCAPSSRNS